MDWIKSTPGSIKDAPGLLVHPFPLSHVGQILYKIALCLLLMDTWIWPARSEPTRSRWSQQDHSCFWIADYQPGLILPCKHEKPTCLSPT